MKICAHQIVKKMGNSEKKERTLSGTQVAQAHFMNADLTPACERCCVTNGYLQRFVWDANGFS